MSDDRIRDKRRYAAMVRWGKPGAASIGASLADDQIIDLCRRRRDQFGRPADDALAGRIRQILHGDEPPVPWR